MAYRNIVFIAAFVYFTLFNLSLLAQDAPTLYLGGGMRFFTPDEREGKLLQSNYTATGGIHFPLYKKETFSWGITFSGGYAARGNNFFQDFAHVLPLRAETGVTAADYSNKTNQRFGYIALGPQWNVKAGNRIWASAVFQMGLLHFRQDTLSVTREMNVNTMVYTKKIFQQNAIDKTALFAQPALKFSYGLSTRLSLWTDINYMIGSFKTSTQTLLPLGSPDGEGKYRWSQILEGSQYTEGSKTVSLHSPAFTLGLSVALGKNGQQPKSNNGGRSSFDVILKNGGANKMQMQQGSSDTATTAAQEVRFKAGAELAEKVKKMKFVVVDVETMGSATNTDAFAEDLAQKIGKIKLSAIEETAKRETPSNKKDAAARNIDIPSFQFGAALAKEDSMFAVFLEQAHLSFESQKVAVFSVYRNSTKNVSCPPAGCGCNKNGGISCSCRSWGGFCLCELCPIINTMEIIPEISTGGSNNNDAKPVVLLMNYKEKMTQEEIRNYLKAAVKALRDKDRTIGAGQVTEILKIKLKPSDIGINEPGIN